MKKMILTLVAVLTASIAFAGTTPVKATVAKEVIKPVQAQTTSAKVAKKVKKAKKAKKAVKKVEAVKPAEPAKTK